MSLPTVSVTGDFLTIDSPVPMIVDLEDQPPRALEAGQHRIAREAGQHRIAREARPFVADER
ncbi:MAG TPA: hypothetical protein VGD58_29555 [Herpetosiphonaceae bacterium]